MTDNASIFTPAGTLLRTTFVAGLAVVLLSVNAQAEKFPVPEALRGCRTDAECGIVDTDCASCCQYDAATKTQHDHYYQERVDFCGPQTERCKCISPKTLYQPRCVENRCVLVSIQTKRKKP